METKVCCVTGHRDIPTDRAVYVEQALRREVLAAIEDIPASSLVLLKERISCLRPSLPSKRNTSPICI